MHWALASQVRRFARRFCVCLGIPWPTPTAAVMCSKTNGWSGGCWCDRRSEPGPKSRLHGVQSRLGHTRIVSLQLQDGRLRIPAGSFRFGAQRASSQHGRKTFRGSPHFEIVICQGTSSAPRAHNLRRAPRSCLGAGCRVERREIGLRDMRINVSHVIAGQSRSEVVAHVRALRKIRVEKRPVLDCLPIDLSGELEERISHA